VNWTVVASDGKPGEGENGDVVVPSELDNGLAIGIILSTVIGALSTNSVGGQLQ